MTAKLLSGPDQKEGCLWRTSRPGGGRGFLDGSAGARQDSVDVRMLAGEVAEFAR